MVNPKNMHSSSHGGLAASQARAVTRARVRARTESAERGEFVGFGLIWARWTGPAGGALG
jgi:hypothetical protein